MKLTPYWWDAAPRPENDPPSLPARSDVVIVGAGYTGLTAAITLARAGLSVAVLDRLRPGEGASSRNGGICSGNLKLSFSELIKKFGLEHAKSLFQEGINARLALAELITSENIDCDYDHSGRFTGANLEKNYDGLGFEADLMNKHLDLGVEMVKKPDQHQHIGTDFYQGGQVRKDIYGLHPGKFVNGLYDRAREAGAEILFPVSVKSIKRGASGFCINTDTGDIRANHVVVATNGYTTHATPWFNRRIIPIPSQIIATEPLPPETMARLMPGHHMYSDTRNLYNYYRPSPDGMRIIFGGRRGADTHDPKQKTRHLKNNLKEIFPELKDVAITHSWHGFTGYSFDMMPHLTTHKGVHYVGAFCGSGVVWAPWVGKMAARNILKTAGLDQGTYPESHFSTASFPTRPLYFGKPWFLPLVIKWYGIKDLLGKGRHSG